MAAAEANHLIVNIGAENHALKSEEGNQALPKKSREASVIDVPETTKKFLLISLKTELRSVLQVLERKESEHESCTIYKVPFSLRDGNESDYTPQVISIGPYHCENKKLKEMHYMKMKFLDDLLKRSSKNSLDKYVEVVDKRYDEALRQYSGKFMLNRMEFLGMMVVDGCFIIEFLLKCYRHDRKGQLNDLKTKEPLLRNDLLLVENQIPFFILEILFAATDVQEFNRLREEDGDDPITIMELALVYFTEDRIGGKLMAQRFAKKDESKNLFSMKNVFEKTFFRKDEPAELVQRKEQSFHNLLHLFHSSLNPDHHRNLHSTLIFLKLEELVASSSFLQHILCFFIFLVRSLFLLYSFFRSIVCSSLLKIRCLIKKVIGPSVRLLRSVASNYSCCINKIIALVTITRGRRRWLHGIPNARYLRDTGFIFKRRMGTSCILDVTCKGKTIEIPPLFIQETTLVRFKNLIAFEQCSSLYGDRFTAFATFLDYLIDTKEDVGILKESGIIDSRLGDDGRVANFFNNLHKGIYLDDKKVPLFEYLEKCYTRHYHRFKFYKWVRKFIPDLFTNPWAVPSMIAAFILLVLTVVQTVYTIYPYYYPRS